MSLASAFGRRKPVVAAGAAATRTLVEAVRQKAKGYVCVTGVRGVMEAQADPRFRAILNHAMLCTPDGMPMVWMDKLNRFRKMGRIYGLNLMLEMCAAPDCRHLL